MLKKIIIVNIFVFSPRNPDGQTCDKKNQFGICAKLSCPPDRNGAICEKRRCVNNDERAAPNVAVISSAVAGVFVLLVILLVGAGFWIRSRRLVTSLVYFMISIPFSDHPRFFLL